MSGLIDTGMVIAEKPRLIFPASLWRVMVAVHKVLESQGNEYGLYLKGKWDPYAAGGPAVVVDPDQYYLPVQRVSPGSIKFLEDPPDNTWNVVIHRHPSGVTNFSGVDNSSINREFLGSLLFIPPDSFPAAVVNVPLAPGIKLQNRADVVITGDFLPEMAAVRARAREAINPAEVAVAEVVEVAGGATGTTELVALPDGPTGSAQGE